MDDLNFSKWNPRWQTIRNINSDNLKIRYKALRNASSNFIARKDVKEYTKQSIRINAVYVAAESIYK